MKDKILKVFHLIEEWFAFGILIILAAIPTAEVLVRKIFSSGIESSNSYTIHLVLLIAFVGGMITSKEDKHLSIVAGLSAIKEPFNTWIRIANATIGCAVSIAFAWAALSLTLVGIAPDKMIGFLPLQLLSLIMPIGYTVMAVRFVLNLKSGTLGKIIAYSGILFGTLMAFGAVNNVIMAIFGGVPDWMFSLVEFWVSATQFMTLPLVIILIIAGVLGAPIFIVLGGIGFILFAGSGGAVETISNEAYTLLIGSAIPAIPLFTLVGFMLSESKSGERLVRFFRAFFGWLPGGVAIVAVVVSAFFTTFTGASGVTILALGGLLFSTLTNSGKHSDEFSTGFLTSSGSIGLLFPPSLAIILYGSMAQVNILHMFIGGILPGVLMVVVMSLVGVFDSLKHKIKPQPFSIKEALSSLKDAVWELLLPVMIIVLYFGGITSLVETAAISVLYVIIIQVFIHRDIKIKELKGIAMKSIPIMGGVLMIMALAKGLSFFIVDEQIPMHLAEWVRANIESKYIFLLLLNVTLLITGCFMDIFSAIMVVVPLIIPFVEVFDINPIHLGIIFLANMELGYLTPPVGLNLFMGSYCFKKPLVDVYKSVVPFFIIQLILVLIITYVPWFSTFLVDLLGK